MRRSSPIEHWSYSSLIAYLRNPLAWYKRYVEKVYDMPTSPSAIVGRSAHKALEYFYQGTEKAESIALGASHLMSFPDEEIDFGVARTKRAQKKKRELMLREYHQAIGFYLARPPRHRVVGVEVSGVAPVPGIALPVKAIADLVVESRGDPGSLDIIDHKFVDTFSSFQAEKPLFVLQAFFNFFVVAHLYCLPVRRFTIIECKKRKNKNGGAQMRRTHIVFSESGDDLALFHRLLKDATDDMLRRKVFLPNPSDMFEGKNSFEIYRMGLLD